MHCDICHKPVDSMYVDGKLVAGPWATMCVKCHVKHGVGLGSGHGQMYEKNKSGVWQKIAG